MRTFATLALAGLLILPALAWSPSSSARHALAPPQLAVLQSRVDGADVPVAYVLPARLDGPVPVILFASPYLYEGIQPHQITRSSEYERLAVRYVPEGYAVAFVPVRGTADAGGCSDLLGPAERDDLDLAVTWLGTQPWSNGNVGMVGVSYDGSTPWQVAATGNPHLKTIVPISGVSDIYDLMYGRGVVELRGLGALNAVYYLDGFTGYGPAWGTRSQAHTLSSVLCPEAWRGLLAAMESSATGERDAGGFFAARNLRPLVEENYRGSILLARGLHDWNVEPSHDFPWVPSLEARGLRVHYLLTQGGHEWPDRFPGWPEHLLAWFDRELKGLDVDVGPRAWVQDSTGAWRGEASWPPRDAQALTLHLGSDGKLATTDASPPGRVVASTTAAGVQGWGVYPCVTCGKFTGAPAPAAWRISGIPEVDATVVPATASGQVTATLYAEKHGLLTRIGWGAVDLRFPEGGDSARVVVPGEPVRVRLPLEPLDAVVPAGGRLVLRLDGDGHSDRLGNPAPVLVHVGGGSAKLVLPTVAR